MPNDSEEVELRNAIARTLSERKKPEDRRRQCLSELLGFMNSEYASVRKAAAEAMCHFFEGLPDMQEDVVNAIWDMCEDMDLTVRIAGYERSAELSGRVKSWTIKLTDVLAQLLQTEDLQEVTEVKRNITKIITNNPRDVLTILCDYLDISGEIGKTADLRGPVLRFLAQDAPVETRQGLISHPEAVPAFFDGMVKALKDATPAETQIMVDKLIYPILQGGQVSPDLCRKVVVAVLETAGQYAGSDIFGSPTPILTYLEEAAMLASLPLADVATAILVIDFFSSNLVSSKKFGKIRIDDQITIFRVIIELWSSVSSKLAAAHNQSHGRAVDASRLLLIGHLKEITETLLRAAGQDDPSAWTLLSRFIMDVAEPRWRITQPTLDEIEQLKVLRNSILNHGTKVPLELVHALKRLVPAEPTRSAPTRRPGTLSSSHPSISVTAAAASASAATMAMSNKRKADSLASRIGGPEDGASSNNSAPSNSSLLARIHGSSGRTLSAPQAEIDSDTSSRSPKRQKGASPAPSLLDRLKSTPSPVLASSPPMPRPHGLPPKPVTSLAITSAPVTIGAIGMSGGRVPALNTRASRSPAPYSSPPNSSVHKAPFSSGTSIAGAAAKRNKDSTPLIERLKSARIADASRVSSPSVSAPLAPEPKEKLSSDPPPPYNEGQPASLSILGAARSRAEVASSSKSTRSAPTTITLPAKPVLSLAERASPSPANLVKRLHMVETKQDEANGRRVVVRTSLTSRIDRQRR